MASRTFIDDIVIAAEGDSPRLLTAEARSKLPEVPKELTPVVNALLAQGTVLAAIPSTPGIGAACYLLNLAAIARPTKG